MISLRIRRFGSSDWTQLDLEGDLSERIGTDLYYLLSLPENDGLHSQVKRDGGEWEELEDFEWEES